MISSFQLFERSCAGGTEVAVDPCVMTRRWPLILLIVLAASLSSPGFARAESMQLKALRIARTHFPGRSGARRLIVAEVSGTAATGIVAYQVRAEGIPPDTYVVFQLGSDGWKSLGVSNSPDGHSQPKRHRSGRK